MARLPLFPVLVVCLGLLSMRAASLFAADDPRHWSVVDDNADTIYALAQFTAVAPHAGSTLDRLLETKTFAVLITAESNFRQRGVSYASSELVLGAWRALNDAPPHVRRNETALLDADMSDPNVAAHVDKFFGTRVARHARVHILVRPAELLRDELGVASVRGVRMPESYPSRHLSALQALAAPGWSTFVVPGKAPDVMVAADRYFGPVVRQFCCEAELRALQRLALASNYALLAVWDRSDPELALGAAQFVARSEPRLDLVVAVLGDAATCAEEALDAEGDQRPAAASYWRRDAAARSLLMDDYNPNGYSVTLHVFRPGKAIARGFVVRGLFYWANSFENPSPQRRAERLLNWTRVERRDMWHDEGKAAIHTIRQRKHKLARKGDQCPLAQRAFVGDSVRVEATGVMLPGGLVFSRWTDRNVTVGAAMDEDDLPGYIHALLLDACLNQVVTAGIQLPDQRQMLHILRVSAIVRGDGTTRRPPAAQDAMWVQTLADAEALVRSDTQILHDLDAEQDAAIIARHVHL